MQVLVEPRVAITVSQRRLTASASADSITTLSILEHVVQSARVSHYRQSYSGEQPPPQ